MSEFRPNHLIPGTNFRYLKVLGEGGQGIVVLAADDFLQTEVVIKLVHAAHAQYLSTRIRDEARTLAKIKHPSIVRVIGGGMTAEAVPRPYFVMERLEGDTLYAVMRRRAKAFSMRTAIDIAIELLEGLDVAHNPPYSLLHRDIKPANIFMSRITPHETRAVLLDFGLAHMFEQASRQTGKRFLGTLEYASPEQLQGKPLTPRSDIYNIGLVLFELCAGRHVFAHCERDRNAYVKAHINDTPIRLSSLGIEMDPALDQIVFSALQKDPAARPKSAHELAHVLKAIRTSLDMLHPPVEHHDKTEEEPFETLWARMGVTPTSAGGGPSSPLWGTSKTSSTPRFDTKEEAPRNVPAVSSREHFARAPTAPVRTEELPNVREGNAARKRFRAAPTESAPIAPPGDVSSPPLVLSARRLRERLSRSFLPQGIAGGAILASIFLFGYYRFVHAHDSIATPPSPDIAIAAPTASAPSSMTAASIAPTSPAAASIAPISIATPTVTAKTAPMRAAPQATRPQASDVAVSNVTRAPPPPSVSAAKPKRPGSGLDDQAQQHIDLITIP